MHDHNQWRQGIDYVRKRETTFSISGFKKSREGLFHILLSSPAMNENLFAAAHACLTADTVADKCRLAVALAEDWSAGRLAVDADQ